MAASQVQVYNRALALARARARVVSIGDNTESAFQCGLFYDEVRQTALRAAHWNFARRQFPLVIDKSALAISDFNTDFGSDFGVQLPPIPWIYSFKLPPDFLAALYLAQASGPQVDIVQIFPNQSYAPGLIDCAIPFELVLDDSGLYKVIVSNISNPTLVYTADVTDPTLWDPQFELAVVHGLAANLAQSMTGDLALAKLRMDTANSALMTARIADANEGTTVINNVPDWMRVRGLLDQSNYLTFPAYGPVFSFL